MITATWYPAPMTWAGMVAYAVATDVAGQVEAAAWDDRYLTAEDRRALR